MRCEILLLHRLGVVAGHVRVAADHKVIAEAVGVVDSLERRQVIDDRAPVGDGGRFAPDVDDFRQGVSVFRSEGCLNEGANGFVLPARILLLVCDESVTLSREEELFHSQACHVLKTCVCVSSKRPFRSSAESSCSAAWAGNTSTPSGGVLDLPDERDEVEVGVDVIGRMRAVLGIRAPLNGRKSMHVFRKEAVHACTRRSFGRDRACQQTRERHPPCFRHDYRGAALILTEESTS